MRLHARDGRHQDVEPLQRLVAAHPVELQADVLLAHGVRTNELCAPCAKVDQLQRLVHYVQHQGNRDDRQPLQPLLVEKRKAGGGQEEDVVRLHENLVEAAAHGLDGEQSEAQHAGEGELAGDDVELSELLVEGVEAALLRVDDQHDDRVHDAEHHHPAAAPLVEEDGPLEAAARDPQQRAPARHRQEDGHEHRLHHHAHCLACRLERAALPLEEEDQDVADRDRQRNEDLRDAPVDAKHRQREAAQPQHQRRATPNCHAGALVRVELHHLLLPLPLSLSLVAIPALFRVSICGVPCRPYLRLCLRLSLH
mmetsp:Transcript_10765/g.44133  ORF Transcript_10765/g.44133 Transcript_10765/m.44133 type:complete len:310 (+) Transcript_10765:760-1689(+)